MKEKLLKTIQNPVFYLLYLEFKTIKIQSFWAKSKISDLISILKHVLWFQNLTGTLQTKLASLEATLVRNNDPLNDSQG